MRLVDSQKPFKVVYATYHHEYLGYLISAHVVQCMPNGGLSLVHQGLYPDNMDQFAAEMDQDDEKLVKLLHQISPRETVKHFKGKPREENDFFLTRFDGQVAEMAHQRIQRILADVMPLLVGKAMFSMANDSYPAQTPLEVMEDKASVLFHFKRNETETVYYPTIKLQGELLKFQRKGAVLLCLNPAWILVENRIFTFAQEVEGKKIKPFFQRFNITIPKSTEREYYQKFITKIIERYRVKAEGFGIRKVQETAQYILRIKPHDKSSFSFNREVRYGTFSFSLEVPGKYKAILNAETEPWVFHRIDRDAPGEKELLANLDKIAPNPNSLTPWEYVEREQALGWLSQHAETLNEWGVKVIQPDDERKIHLDRPKVELTTIETGDWFDIKAVVKIGAFEIPFMKFRGHVLKGKREYELPDGSIAILPEEWFSDYRHLLEVSKSPNDDEHLRLKRYQAPLLNMPSREVKKTTLADTVRQLSDIPEVEAPANLKATLRNYQQQGFNWLYFLQQNRMGGILADDMGLGKTLQTLALLQKEFEKGITQASLVVVPTSLVHNWFNEAKRFAPDLRVLIHTGINRSKHVERFEHYHIILTTYGIVRQDIDRFKTFPFHYAILDESQTIKNPDSKTAKAVRKLVSSHRLSITGTPVENTVMDIWSQMSFLNPGLLGTETFFKRFYVTPIERDQDVKKSAKLRRIIYPYILRRKKQQVEKDLPPRIEKLHYCEMEETQQHIYEEIRSQYRNYLLELINTGTWRKNKLNILTGLQKLRQIAIHPQMIDKEEYTLEQSGKYKEVKRLLQLVIEREGSKVLIFSQFVKMLTLLREDLDQEGIRYNYLDGATKDRQAQVDSFQKDKDIQVFLISLKAGGVGLNLTAADYVFILDPWWNPAVENQAIDRSHRIGQQRTVFYYKFITTDTIEEKILSLQRKKAQLSDDIIAVEDDIYKSLEADDLEELLG